MMDPDRCWSIIEIARRETPRRGERMESVKRSLSELTVEDVVGFHNRVLLFQRQAYTWDLCGAAYLIKGGYSHPNNDYDFESFRAWLVAQGGDVYRAALNNADILADVVDEGGGCPHAYLAYAALETWEEKTGKNWGDHFPFIEFLSRTGQPGGDPWDISSSAELVRRLPRLWQRFGW